MSLSVLPDTFGVTNGVACFQCAIDKTIKRENLDGVFAYLNDVTICGKDQPELDRNLEQFLKIGQ